MLQDELAAEEAGLEPVADREGRLAVDAQAAWSDIGAQHWANPGEDDDEEPR